MYAGILQTYQEDGVKCIILYTDGDENSSSYSRQEVIELSVEAGIPVYIVGIGDDVDTGDLTNIAQACGGEKLTSRATRSKEPNIGSMSGEWKA